MGQVATYIHKNPGFNPWNAKVAVLEFIGSYKMDQSAIKSWDGGSATGRTTVLAVCAHLETDTKGIDYVQLGVNIHRERWQKGEVFTTTLDQLLIYEWTGA